MKSCNFIFVLASIFLCIGLVRARCGTNEERSPCGAICEPSCRVPKPEVCIQSCIVNGCRCKNGFFRDEYTKRCVTWNRCSRKSPGSSYRPSPSN